MPNLARARIDGEMDGGTHRSREGNLPQQAALERHRRRGCGRLRRRHLPMFALFALLLAGCEHQPLAPTAVAADPVSHTPGVSVSLILQPSAHAMRVYLEGVEKVTRVALLLDWDGDVWWAGIARNPWWFANSPWTYAFSLERNHRRMAFEVWRESPVEGSGSLGLLHFRADYPFPTLQQGEAWVNEKRVPLHVRVRGEGGPLEGESWSSLEKDAGR